MTPRSLPLPLLALAAALLLLPLTLAAPAAADPADTCRYYSNMAFNDRRTGRATTFRMDLAQDCVDAAVYARSKDRGARDRAEAYLALLEEYRQTLVGILTQRARDRSKAERGDVRQYVRPAVRPVSRAGAYLIARQMGVVRGHEDWTEWRRSASLADPRFRID